MARTELTPDNNNENVFFFSVNGIMLYFAEDKQFIYVVKETTPDMKTKVMAIQQAGGSKQKFYPMEVHMAVLRKNITEENISQFYDREVMRFTGSSPDFIQKYFTNPIYKRHTKTKGVMNRKDVLVSTWIRFTGTRENMAVFGLGIGGTDGVITN